MTDYYVVGGLVEERGSESDWRSHSLTTVIRWSRAEAHLATLAWVTSPNAARTSCFYDVSLALQDILSCMRERDLWRCHIVT